MNSKDIRTVLGEGTVEEEDTAEVVGIAEAGSRSWVLGEGSVGCGSSGLDRT
jgi:hypothetical protein